MHPGYCERYASVSEREARTIGGTRRSGEHRFQRDDNYNPKIGLWTRNLERLPPEPVITWWRSDGLTAP